MRETYQRSVREKWEREKLKRWRKWEMCTNIMGGVSLTIEWFYRCIIFDMTLFKI
jgi:hypothetical protein